MITAHKVAGEPAAGPRIRWAIAGLLFLASVINYLDRQNLSILARTIQNDLRMSDTEYGYVVQAFLLAYTLTYAVAGRITDLLGTRTAMAVFIVWWSVSDMLTSLGRSALSLGVFRFLLGIGEPGMYTVAPKAVSEWFPARERALVIGFYTAGATLGATLAPPLISLLASRFSWRPVFLVTGSLGLIWVVPWLWTCRRAARMREPAPVSSQTQDGAWRAILVRKETWLLLTARVITDPVWYFYLFWFPKYLTDSRHLTLLQVGRVAWVVYLASDFGCLAGGWLSGRLIARGAEPVSSRVRVMTLAACLLPLSPLIAFTPSVYTAIAVAALAALGHMTWQVTMGALIVDLFPQVLVGTVFGIIAAGSGFGGMVSTGIVARTVSNFSYAPLFIAMGFLHPLALLLVWQVGRTTGRSSHAS